MGEPCDLVLAGLHVRGSSSAESESDLVARHIDLRGRVLTVGHVSSVSRAWLLGNAAAVLYPSSAEGFGFVPYEAAALGTPTTFTGFGPLREIAGPIDVPKSWQVSAYAQDLRRLLSDPGVATARVFELREAIETYSWQRFADGLIDLFGWVVAHPPVAASAITGGAADSAALSAILSSRTWRATEPLRRVGRRLRRA
jgi:glycosyltransferase involved in cell wall biosynthesis